MERKRDRRMLFGGRGGGNQKQRRTSQEEDESEGCMAVMDEPVMMMSMMAQPLASVSLRLPIRDRRFVLAFTNCCYFPLASLPMHMFAYRTHTSSIARAHTYLLLILSMLSENDD